MTSAPMGSQCQTGFFGDFSVLDYKRVTGFEPATFSLGS